MSEASVVLSNKVDILALLAEEFPPARYLELCTSGSGADFKALNRRNFSVVHRLMYRCPPDYDDGGAIDFRAEGLDIGPCIDELRRRGLRYDVILIDSWHDYETSARDLREAYRLLEPGGTLVVHDCLPKMLEETTPTVIPGSCPGQSYRAYLDFVRTHPDVTYCTVATDQGCGVIRKPRLKADSGIDVSRENADGANSEVGGPPRQTETWARWSALGEDFEDAFQFFMKHRRELSNPVKPGEFLPWLRHQPKCESPEGPSALGAGPPACHEPDPEPAKSFLTDEKQLSDALLNTLTSPQGQHFLQQAIFNSLWLLVDDTNFMLRAMSTQRSAEFVRGNIPLHLGMSMTDLRRKAIEEAPANGLYLEFGTWTGHWIRGFAEWRPDLTFYGFDSFEGLPGPWSTKDVDYFDLGGNLPTVPNNVTLVKGWFDETLPDFLKDHPEPVSFIHIDCDRYDSTMSVLSLLHPRLRTGTRIVFDDYLVAPNWEAEEKKAFDDFVCKTGIQYEFTGWQKESPGCSVSVVLTDVP